MKYEFQISNSILEWIAHSRSMDVRTFAQDIVETEEQIEKFVNGIINKTQASRIAKLANIPFGFLFLDKPPEITRPTLPDFRNTQQAVPLSTDFYDTLEDINNKIEWYRDFLKKEDIFNKLDFVGRVDYKISEPEYVAQNIAKSIGFNIETDLDSFKEESVYFKNLVTRFENLGILIFQNSIVKNNTKKPLSVNEFRGFAITDDYAPAVFINTKDSKSAQIFTLLHEVAHLWIGKEGVSDWSVNDNATEAFCNEVAAHFLMPNDMFKQKWQTERKKFPNSDIYDTINVISKIFKVSRLATTIKAVKLKLIASSYINSVKNQHNGQQSKKANTGGNPYKSYPLRNSTRLTKIILTQTINQHILISEAAKLLNLKSPSVMKLYSNMRDSI